MVCVKSSSSAKMVTLTLLLFYCVMGGATAKNQYKIIIVGAGMSGMSAGKTLSDAGIENMLILEATNRIGGRVNKTTFAKLSVELGANWVEGVGGKETNPIWTMVHEKLKLKTYLSNFHNLTSNTYKQEGGRYEKSDAEKIYDEVHKVYAFSKELSKKLTKENLEDISVLTAQRLSQHVPTTPLEMAFDYFHNDYEFAEPPRVTSLKNTQPLPTFENFGYENYFVADSRGFESVVHLVAKQYLHTNDSGDISDKRLLLNKPVIKIQYNNSGVTVETEHNRYTTDYVMVSASIGVLQTNLIKFEPDLPEWKLLAMDKFDMAVYTKIFLKFPFKFWPDGSGTEFFVYAHEKRGYYTIWQHLERIYPNSSVLLVTVTDDESRRIEQQSDSETKEEIMAVLRNMFENEIPNATDIYIPRWWSNKFYKGSFSNWPIGVSKHEFDQIRAPVERVYFTGEHTSEHYNGYLHGAYLAGNESAHMLLDCIHRKKCTYHHVSPKGTRA